MIIKPSSILFIGLSYQNGPLRSATAVSSGTHNNTLESVDAAAEDYLRGRPMRGAGKVHGQPIGSEIALHCDRPQAEPSILDKNRVVPKP